MIRQAQTEDWPALVELGERLIAKTPYSSLKLDRRQALQVYGQCLSSALGFAAVSEKDGQITGLLLGLVDRLWWSRARFASDLVFYCEDGRSGLPLLRRFVAWAWTVPGVVEVTCAQSSAINVEQTAKLYSRCGFTKVGDLWTQQKLATKA